MEKMINEIHQKLIKIFKKTCKKQLKLKLKGKSDKQIIKQFQEQAERTVNDYIRENEINT
jgi:hypothetical protein